MVKKRVIYALSVTALAFCAGFLFPGLVGNASAYTLDVDGYAVPEGETEEAKYNDLVAAISEGYNIRLGDNIIYYPAVSKAPAVAVDHSMTLDLNGYILSTATTKGGTGGNTGIAVTGEETVLTIMDSSVNGTGAIRYDHSGNTSPETIRVESGAKLILNSGKVYSSNGANGAGIAINMKGAGATFEMNGGEVNSHEDSTSSSNYGVRFVADGSFKMTGGQIHMQGPALSGAKVIQMDISGDAVLSSVRSNDIDVSGASNTGTISGITIGKISMLAGPVFNNVTVTDLLELKGGTGVFNNITVNGLTKVTKGTITFGNGVNLVGGLVYDVTTATSSLTIEGNARVNGFQQLGHATSASYTNPETSEKVNASYDVYGSLIITGGAFTGDFIVASREAAETANSVRKDFVDGHNAFETLTAWTYADVAHVPEVSGGTFENLVDTSTVVNGYDEYAITGGYMVDETPNAYQGGDLYMLRGDTMTLDLGEIGNTYATLEASGSNVTLDGRDVDATTVGNGTIVINYNTLVRPMTVTIGTYVYSVAPSNDDVIESEADRNAVADYANTQVKSLFDSNEDANNALQLYPEFDPETEEMIATGVERLKNALISGDTLETYLDAWDLAEDYWNEAEGMNALRDQMAEGEKIAMVYNMVMGLYDSNGVLLGELTDLGENEIEFDVEIPEELREAPEGVVREFSVLRFHRGVVTRLDDAMRDGDALKAKSALFSTYVLTYTDTERPVTPDTGSFTISENGSASSFSLAASVLVGVAVVIITFKKLRIRQ